MLACVLANWGGYECGWLRIPIPGELFSSLVLLPVADLRYVKVGFRPLVLLRSAISMIHVPNQNFLGYKHCCVAHESVVDVHHGRSRWFMDTGSSSSVSAAILFDVVVDRKENTRFSPAQGRWSCYR